MKGYLDLAREEPGRCLALRYEDMKADPASQIRAVAAFLGVENLTEAEVEEVAAATTLEAMRADPSTNYGHWKELGLANTRGGKDQFLRKGTF